ncbi:sulfate transporter [Mycobacterium parmense]|nr:sulfate transporter [Mycobacterium parmense]
MRVHTLRVATVLNIEGEIDAANAEAVAAEIRRFSRLKAPLILDLSRLEFLGSAGLHALLVLDEEHRRDRLHYNVIGGRALNRLISVTPADGLPLADSVPDALGRAQDAIRARRRVVRGAARQHEPQRDRWRAGCPRSDR